MPSNVSIEFEQAQTKYDQANSPEAKLTALMEMKSTAPQHKGAENLRSEINRKISMLKASIERTKSTQSKKGSSPNIYVKKRWYWTNSSCGPAQWWKKLVTKQVSRKKSC